MEIKPGDTVLLTGAPGGLGTFMARLLRIVKSGRLW